MISYFTPIPQPTPNYDFSIQYITSKPEQEPFLIVKTNDHILVDLQYVDNVPIAVSTCYMRENVYYRLLRASKKLPSGYRFKIYDAWRSLAVQKYLYTTYKEIIKEKYKNLSTAKLENVINTFVSPPSEDARFPPAHTTGGAIDLTIIDEFNRELDMGTNFDEFDSSAQTRFFEGSDSLDIANNRRMLYNIMTSEGFTNLPTEWWHYDFGTNFWAFYSSHPSKYLGVFIEDDIIREVINK